MTEKVTNPEFKIFAEILKEELRTKRQKRNFCLEHQFKKEAEFLTDQLSIMEAILDEIEAVGEGLRSAKDIRFNGLR